MSRTFQQLVDAFPLLGEDGARPEAREARHTLDAGLLASLRAKSTSRSDELQRALELWSRNNEHLWRFGDLVALRGLAEAEQETTRQIKAARAGAFGEPELSRSSAGTARLRACAYRHLMDPTQAADLGSIELGRGFCLPNDQFNTQLALDGTTSVDRPLACSVELQFVPLHFAWKCLNNASPSTVGTTSVILLIRPGSTSVRGHWTGDIESSTAGASFEWQAEVILSPGSKYLVTDHEELAAGPHRLVRVTTALI